MVFRMGAQHGAGLARRDENVEQRFVVDLQPVVGHEDLDRGVPLFHQCRDVVRKRFQSRIGDDHVKGIVDDRALPGERMIVCQDLGQRHANMLGSKRDDRGGSTEGGRGRGTFECIGVHDARGRQLLDMGMAVDAAGQHQLAACVELALAGRQAATDGSDTLACDGDIGLEYFGGGRHASAADHDIVGGFGHEVLQGIMRPPGMKSDGGRRC